MGASIYCSDCGECLAEADYAEAALAMSCGRCGCLVELAEWDRPEDSGVRDTIPGEERVEPVLADDGTPDDGTPEDGTPDDALAFTPGAAPETQPEGLAEEALDTSPNVFSDAPVSKDLAPDSWRTTPIDAPSPPGPRVEPFALAADVPSPTPAVTWLVSLDNRADDRAMGPKQVAAAVRRGEISPANLAWRAGMPEWLALSEIPEFATVVEERRELGAAPTPPTPPVGSSSETPLSPGAIRGPSPAVGAASPAPRVSPVPVSPTAMPRHPHAGGVDADDGLSRPLGDFGAPTDRPSLAEVGLEALSSPPPAEEDKRKWIVPAAMLLLAIGGGAAAALFMRDQQDSGRTAPALDSQSHAHAQAQAQAVGQPAVVEPEPAAEAAPEAEPAAEPAPEAEPKPAPKAAPRPVKRAPTPKSQRPVPAPAPRTAPEPRKTPTAAFKPLDPAGEKVEPFDLSAASMAVDQAALRASSCRQPGDPSGVARIRITFANSGRVTSAVVEGKPFMGTATGGCIAKVMRSAQIPKFSGKRRPLVKTVVIR